MRAAQCREGGPATIVGDINSCTQLVQGRSSSSFRCERYRKRCVLKPVFLRVTLKNGAALCSHRCHTCVWTHNCTHKFAPQLLSLNEMGFTDVAANITALQKCDGDISRAALGVAL